MKQTSNNNNASQLKMQAETRNVSKVKSTGSIIDDIKPLLAEIAKRNAALLKAAKEQYQPRLCPFCHNNEILSNQTLVEIYRGSTQPEFTCSCKGFKKEAERISIEQYTKTIKAALPNRFKNCTMDNYIGLEDVKSSLKQAISNRSSIILFGTVGTGKTHLAIACLKEFLIGRNNRSDKFVVTSIPKVLTDVFTSSDALKPVQTCDILLIDDLGMESVKEWGLEKIYSIVNYRYEAMLPMIITTNLNSGELKDKIGQRSFSRIMDMCKIFVINGEDYRTRHLKQEWFIA